MRQGVNRGTVIEVDRGALAEALEAVMLWRAGEEKTRKFYTDKLEKAASRGPIWAELKLSMRHSADRVLAAVQRASAEARPSQVG